MAVLHAASTCLPLSCRRPTSVNDARRIVAETSHIRALGARRSFDAIADCTGDLIDLTDIDPGFVIDLDRCTVTS
jgi:xylitol oxidase